MFRGSNPLIFINYRRGGITNATALQLKHSLEIKFGDGTVFLDTESIASGDYWEKTIFNALESAVFMVTLIHGTWLREQDPMSGMRRIDMEEDWVRREINFFLDQSDKHIIPVLLDNAEQLKGSYLPEIIRNLASIQTIQIRTNAPYLDHDVNIISSIIQKKMNANVYGASIGPYSGGEISSETEKTQVAEGQRRVLEEAYPLPKYLFELQNLKGLKAPFIGLQYFEASQAPIYFGRDEEILQLLELIKQPDYPVLLFYGPSGVGKSSLLNAGLLPRIEGKYHLDLIYRRDFDEGLTAQLKQARSNYSDANQTGKPVLHLFDQVEEIYTNPNAAIDDEVDTFFDALWDWVRTIRETQSQEKIILSFRVGYFSHISKQLEKRNIPHQKFFLERLSREGARAAIVGVSQSKRLKPIFHLEVEESFVDEILFSIFKQANESQVAPLLQLQLRTMWDVLVKEKKPLKRFDLNLYDAFRKKGLSSMVDYLLNQLSTKWESVHENGLILDLLNYLITEQDTAGERTFEELKLRYHHNKALDLIHLIRDLENVYLVFFKNNRTVVRLAHDQLASIIRKAYRISNKPAQRAWRIIEAKKMLPTPKLEFSKGDLENIEEGQPYMASIPRQLVEFIERDRKKYIARSQQRFQLAFNNARSNIDQLVYETAFENIRLAALENLESEQVQSLAWEIPMTFFWREQYHLLEDWAEFLYEQGWISKEQLEVFPNTGRYSFGQDFPNWLTNVNETIVPTMLARHFPTMVTIPGGTYLMGSNEGLKHERPLHRVQISKYQISSTTVTFWQYGLYCLINKLPIPNDSSFGKANRPIINVNWFDAAKYCNWLSQFHGFRPVYHNLDNGRRVTCDWEADGYRLPTEAEWEYAAGEAKDKGRDRFGNGKKKADPKEMNYNGDAIINRGYQSIARISGKRSQGTNEVDKFLPSSLGLFDMSGNVYEWCWDVYPQWQSHQQSNIYYEAGIENNPIGWESNSHLDYRVVRGGSWKAGATSCRIAHRQRYLPIHQSNDVGFRVVRGRH